MDEVLFLSVLELFLKIDYTILTLWNVQEQWELLKIKKKLMKINFKKNINTFI